MSASSENARLETFCDGVIAIAITLLVLDLKVPVFENAHSLTEIWHVTSRLWISLFAFLFSFTIIFIAWLGHHNLLKQVHKNSGFFLFANGFFLLTIILMPFQTAFMAEYLNTEYVRYAIVFYSIVAMLHNIGWNLLYMSILGSKPLAEPNKIVLIKESSKGALYGFMIYIILLSISWWFPYIVLGISTIMWIGWLVVSLNLVNQGNAKS